MPVRVFDDPETLAVEAARCIAAAAAHTLAERPNFRIGLSGGSTPIPLYRKLARHPIDWSRTTILFADERAVPPDHPESNFGLVREHLIEPGGIAADRVARMRGEEEDLDAAARAYEGYLAEPIDLLVLGMGADGHTASLFPESALILETDRRAAAVTDSPKPPARRITITPRVIAEAREVIMQVTGAGKAWAVLQALEIPGSPLALPARLVANRDWYLDSHAADRLPASRRTASSS